MFILATLVMQVIWVAGLMYASSRTIQSHAYVLNNVHGLFIVVIGFFNGQKIYLGEWGGLATAIVGCVIMMTDPSAARVD